MSISTPFIFRPIATLLLTIGMALVGGVAYFLLPVAPLPQVDYPTISVTASLPGAAPDTMAATVATPLERALGAIAGVNEMTSSSSMGSTRITLQFDLTRTVDSAAHDVQAAINAARTLLPSGMPGNPTYRKVNPADAPIMILALTSESLTRGQMYDAASTVLAQKLAQVEGVGQASINGGALPAVRVELDPVRLAANGVSLDAVRTAITATNANRPLGAVEREDHYWQVATNDQARTAAEYAPLVLRWNNGNAVRLSDVADVTDSVQDIRNYGVMNGKPAVLLQVFKQPDANILQAVDKVRAMLPQLRASINPAIDVTVISDRTPTLRASVKEVQNALLISIALVIMVVFVFLRRLRATLIPAVAVPASLMGTFGVMYLCGYTLDNLSLMALTVAAGFVVDDAIVVLENVMRHMERGKTAMQAAIEGAREIGFTVVSMSLSLIAVFVPILFMAGIVGRFFREFAVVMSAAILVSMIISLTTTPMMCAACCARRQRRSAAAPNAPGALHAPLGCVLAAHLAGHGSLRAARDGAVPPHPGLGSAPPARGAAESGGGHRPQHPSLPDHRQGLHAQRGHGPRHGLHPCRPVHVLSGHGAPHQAFSRCGAAGPGGGVCDRLHRRRPGQCGQYVHVAQAHGRAQGVQRRGHQPPA
jgi:multidrug efflux pump